MRHIICTSLTRIADFDESAQIHHLSRDDWAWGDYVACDVVESPGMERFAELTNGRLVNVAKGDRLLGALGSRFATLAMTGSWEDVGSDGRMQALTAAGLFGRVTSMSPYESAPPIELHYHGHVMHGGQKLNMRNFLRSPARKPFDVPVILVVGSSMSSGKTKAARVLIRRLKEMDLSVMGLKLTGAGRYRDVLHMQDAGADVIFDFVDAGMPSTVCAEPFFRRMTQDFLDSIGDVHADVAVVEAGASPLEPYNGAAALDLLKSCTKLTVLCGSDPYAVLGITMACSLQADLVAGITCNTEAGRELVTQLTGLRVMNLTDPACYADLDGLLRDKVVPGPC